jgi:hypothetical protein
MYSVCVHMNVSALLLTALPAHVSGMQQTQHKMSPASDAQQIDTTAGGY